MNPLFPFRENAHIFRNFQILSNSTKKAVVRSRFQTVPYRSPILWAKLPQECKCQTSLHAFKVKIRN